MKYYLYQIRNKRNNYIYVGVHYSKYIKDRYMGSGTNIKEAMKIEGKGNFDKTILEYFENPEDCLAREREIVNEDFIKRKDTYNIILGGGGFNTLGCVTVKDKNGNTFMVNRNDPRYLSGILIPIAKNKVCVKDANGNTFQVDKSDPRYLNGELVHNCKGLITAKDKNGNIFSISKNDPRYLSGEFMHHTKGIKNIKHVWLGRLHSEETKNLMRKNRKGKQIGSKNSQYNTIWITNGKENKKITKEDKIPEGWKMGRKIKSLASIRNRNRKRNKL